MEYDFISHMDRVGKDALALDVDALRLYMPKAKIKKGVSLIPMSVADMNFATAPSITDALKKRVEHPAFGYFIPRKEYYDAILKWQNEQNGADVSQDDIGYTNGVLGGLISALNVFCSRGDDVLLNTPAYVGFTGCLSDNGYHAVHSPMKQDADGIWRMDFDDMEQKIIKNHIHAAIFCSPHNPTGRVWERWEIEEFMALCKKHDVYVVADEIWSDLILYGNKHIPTQSVSEDAKNRVVALYSLAKTFNLAGIVGAYSVIYNPTIRDRINKESSLSRYNEMSVLYMHSVMGAYTDDGKEWLNQLRKVLAQNVDYAKE